MSIPTPQQKPDLPEPVPPPPVTPASIQVTDGLLIQYQVLSEQLAGLVAQRRVLRSQIASPQADVAATAASQLAKVETQIAKASVDLADVRGRLNSRPGQPGVRPPFEFPQNQRRPGMDPDAIAAISVTFILAVLMPISIGITRRLLRRNPKETGVATSDVIIPRLDRLEQSVEAIAIEIERIAEGQRFVTKVMAERPVQTAPRPSPPTARAAADPAEASNQALGEAKPFLALGAGPIEPIRVPERQAVRQSITPH
jgi:hypothetical protein